MPSLQDNTTDCPRWSHYEGWCEGFEHDCDLDTVGYREPDCDRDTCDGQHTPPADEEAERLAALVEDDPVKRAEADAAWKVTPPADYTARADIVALQGQMQVVTRFLSGQFPEEWGTPPADVCPNPDVKPYGQQRLDGFFCRTCGAEFGPDQSGKAEAHGKPPADVCPEPDCKYGWVPGSGGVSKDPCPSCGTGDRPAVTARQEQQ